MSSSVAADDAVATEPDGRDGAEDDVFLFPASFSQERQWILDQLEADGSVYNMPAATRLAGRLDVDALARALNEIVERHEALRTTFRYEDGQLLQAIAPRARGELPVIDLGDVPSAKRAARVERLAGQEARRPFVLRTGPLLRVALVRVDADEHVLLLTMHHIVSDGWSMGVLIRELAALYGAYSEGKRSPLAELPVQYADYAVWQREQLQGELLEEQLSYWRERLGHDPPALQLPADRARPPLQTYRGANVTTRLPKELSDRIEALDEQEGASLFMTMLAAFKALLARYTGQDDVVVGTFVANRTRPEVEGLIGFFVNTLALRTDLAGDPTFRELVGRVRESSLGAYAHQDLPFEKLLEELQPHRDLSRTPFFQVMLVVQNAPTPPLELPGLTLTLLPRKTRRSNFDLTLWITEDAGELELAFEYSTDLFEPETVARLAGHYRTLLEGAVADPDTRLSRLPLLSDEERQQLLVDFNQTSREHENADRCIHQLFEIQADRTPDAPALVDGERTLTYGELNEAANRLAHDLIREHGIGPETLVAVCLPRTADAIIALLGILKAGAAYVPLDPNHPRERLEFMLEDAAAPVLVTEHALLDRLPHYPATLCLDTAPDEIRTQPDGNPDIPTKPDHLAYVIYTSGSTGRPKGVMLEHRSLVSYVDFVCEEFALGPRDRVLQFASLTFDTSAEEIFPCLARGATLVLRPEDMIDSTAGFVRACDELGITVLDLPTGYWNELAAGFGREGVTLPPSVRLTIIAGEKALADRLALWHRHVGPEVRLVNTYGLTETTIVATLCDLRAGEDLGPRREVPIGRPVPRSTAYVLDRDLNPVPIGAVGELYAGGACPARGYLGRPSLTAERFVPDPFGSEPSARLYRTGDLARHTAQGTLEFAGRADHQVKLRGFRVELGEIEAALLDHPAVQYAVVVARDRTETEKTLVAYLVSPVDPPPTTSELRAFLSRTLPAYMLPSAWVTLESLPLNSNGKLDRAALPEPDTSRPRLASEYVAPGTEVEATLERIWSDVLRVERVGIHDNFFDLGGHSMLGVQLHFRVCQELGVEMPLFGVFQSPTVAGQAVVVGRKLNEAKAAPILEARELLARIHELPQDQVDSLLGNFLAQK